VRDEVVNILFAGRDTTAATLSWLFYELARSPATVQKIRAEIRSVVGDGDRDGDGKSKPTLDELKRMKYLHRAVNEILRLYPPVPINLRFAARDTTIHLSQSQSQQPLIIHKGDAIAYSTLLIHRRADLYPPVSATFPPPDQFSPERWEHWTPTPWTYIPFNGGPRICPGQQFALTEVYFTTVRILQRFRSLELVEDSAIGRDGDARRQFVTSHIVAMPGRPVRVRFGF
jgi:cytochrome P450